MREHEGRVPLSSVSRAMNRKFLIIYLCAFMMTHGGAGHQYA